jgi:hypothetical protein
MGNLPDSETARADLLEQTPMGRKNGEAPSAIMGMDMLAQPLVETSPGRLQTLAVRGVQNEHARSKAATRRLEAKKIAAHPLDVMSQPRSISVVSRDLDSTLLCIEADDRRRCPLQNRSSGLPAQVTPFRRCKGRPALKKEGAVEPRWDSPCHEACLDGDRTGAAHPIHERNRFFPSRTHQNRCGERLAQGGTGMVTPIPTPMEMIPGCVQADLAVVFHEMDKDLLL